MTDKMNEYIKRNEAAWFLYNFGLVADITADGQDIDHRKSVLYDAYGGGFRWNINLLDCFANLRPLVLVILSDLSCKKDSVYWN